MFRMSLTTTTTTTGKQQHLFRHSLRPAANTLEMSSWPFLEPSQ